MLFYFFGSRGVSKGFAEVLGQCAAYYFQDFGRSVESRSALDQNTSCVIVEIPLVKSFTQ
jgi:hypothetical protein